MQFLRNSCVIWDDWTNLVGCRNHWVCGQWASTLSSFKKLEIFKIRLVESLNEIALLRKNISQGIIPIGLSSKNPIYRWHPSKIVHRASKSLLKDMTHFQLHNKVKKSWRIFSSQLRIILSNILYYLLSKILTGAYSLCPWSCETESVNTPLKHL